MDQDKIQAFKDQKAVSEEERAKIMDSAFALSSVLTSQKDVEKAIKQSILQLAKIIKSHKPEVSVTNQQPFPEYDEVIKAVQEVVAEVKNSNQKLETVEQKEADFSPITKSLENLSRLVAKLPTDYPETKIPEPVDYSQKFDEVRDAVSNLPAPIINVEKTEIPDNSKDLDKIVKAVEKIKFPEIPKTDFSAVEKAVKSVQKSIDNLQFPVANYVLPFKDINGKAVQVQLDADGKVPTSGGGSGGGLTDTELRATPVPVDTELPAAAALSDATANPTTPMVGSAMMVWDVVAWRRWFAAASADALGDVFAPFVNSYPYGWNGTSWDKIRGDATNGALVNLGTNNDVIVSSETFTKKTVTASSSGNNTIHTPASGKKIRLHFFGYSAGSSVTGVLAGLRFASGGTVFDQQYLVAPGQPYARNIQAGKRYIDGGTDEALIVNLNAAQTVYVNIEVEEVT